jgi:hypothetical protein
MVAVVVGCALPQGVILRVGEMVEGIEQTPMGPRTIRKFKETGKLTLPGNAADLNSQNAASPTTYGYRLTRFEGIQAERFLRWVEMQTEADKHHDEGGGLLQSRAIIWSQEPEKIEKEAAKLIVRDGMKFGLEPLDPNNLPNELRSQRTKMTTADDQRSKLDLQTPVAFIDAETGRRGYGEKSERRRLVRRNNGNGNRTTVESGND